MWLLIGLDFVVAFLSVVFTLSLNWFLPSNEKPHKSVCPILNNQVKFCCDM
jgi:hypothetical protein